MNWIFSFIAGILVGQEFSTIPKIRPILEDGLAKIVQYSNNLSEKKLEKEKEKENRNWYGNWYGNSPLGNDGNDGNNKK